MGRKRSYFIFERYGKEISIVVFVRLDGEGNPEDAVLRICADTIYPCFTTQYDKVKPDRPSFR